MKINCSRAKTATTFFRICFYLLFFSVLPAAPLSADHGPEVRVGIFPMKPLNFVDQDGASSGLYPDLLREIAHQEYWHPVFVPGSWGECYDRLMKGEIDLITTVAYSQGRTEIFDFSKEPVADIWGKVYTRTDTQITGIRDLDGKKVAVARRDINGKNFIKTAERFDVHPVTVELESHHDILVAIRQGAVVAGVVPQHFGFREAAKYDLVPTTIEFEPFSVFFAAKKGQNAELLKRIDQHLAEWKRDPDSYYFRRVAFWMGGAYEHKGIPHWLYASLLGILAGAVVLAVINLSLKRKVRLRTEEIANRETRFRKLLETTKAIPWEMDLVSNRFTYIGPRIVEVFGYPLEYWGNRDDWESLIHPQDRAEAVSYCDMETSRGKDHDFVYRGLHKDGRIIWVHDIVTVVTGKSGPEKLYGYFVDISVIREHEERFQKMFREHNAVMLLIDPQSGVIVDANDSASNYYGYLRQQLIDMSMSEINTLSKEELAKLMDKARDKAQNYFEMKHRLASGEVRDVETYSYPIMIGNRPLLFSIIHDISERKKLLEEHGRAQQLVALGTIAAGVAHEINNPIQGIINYSTMLQHAPDNREQVMEVAQRIFKESYRIAKITRDLLSYAKDNRDESISVDILEQIESVLSLIETKIKRSGIGIEIELAEDLPRITLNPQGFQQIIMNLVDNAYDALRYKDIPTAEKIIEIRGRIIEGDGRTDFCLEVEDNGIGMSEEVVSKARDAFFSTKPSTEGTGLGLSIVSEIVAKHQGRFEIESREGEYTRARILLPATRDEQN